MQRVSNSARGDAVAAAPAGMRHMPHALGVQLTFQVQALVRMCAGASLAAALPSMLHQIRAPSPQGLLLGMANSSLSFFLFSYQVGAVHSHHGMTSTDAGQHLSSAALGQHAWDTWQTMWCSNAVDCVWVSCIA